MKEVFLLVVMLALAGKQSDPPQDAYIGKWAWVKSELSDRGGTSTATPASTAKTAVVEITPDFKLKTIENGVLTCSTDFKIVETNDERYHSADVNCQLGIAQLKNDTLIFFRYLGCPSQASYYVRIEE